MNKAGLSSSQPLWAQPGSGPPTENAARRNAGSELVRPFILTQGRTRTAGEDLRIETMVETTPEGELVPAAFERHEILQLCRTPLSIAEIAARLRVPLGVAKVFVGDMTSEGLLAVHHTDPVDIELSTLMRLIDRVRAI